ncbi:nuclear pore complex protein Nup50-like [Glandiceps talaboti]
MSKRSADKELTDRNWDDEEPVEEAGTFSKASDDQIARRQIKKAKRRGIAGTSSTSSPGSAFSGFGGFTGFGGKPEVSFTKPPQPIQGLSNGSSTKTTGVFSPSSTISASSEMKSSPVIDFKPSPAVDFKSSPAVNFKPFSSESTKPETKITKFDVLGPSKTVTTKPSYSSQYCKRLRNLNESVSSWIQKHVKDNPLCDLSPVFRDYEKHLKELEEKFPPTSSESEGEKSQDDIPSTKRKLQTESVSSDVGTPGSTGFTFKADSSIDTSASTPSAFNVSQTKTTMPLLGSTTTVKPSFEFGAKKDSSSTDSSTKSTFSFSKMTDSNKDVKPGIQFGSTGSSGFSFGAKDTTTSIGTLGTFGAKDTTASIGSVGTFGGGSSTAPFSFGLTKPKDTSEPRSTGATNIAEEDEDQPPKVEVKAVEEKDALYSVRCKLFFKKDSSFTERGVGMLHLKKSGSVLQLLVRADTNLGNILLNIGIPPSLPITKKGKNNMMFIAAPNPPGDKLCPQCSKKYPHPQESNECESGCKPEAVPILVRVKTGDIVDTLIEKIKEFKE